MRNGSGARGGERLACALAIGGLDPGGGAGIAADLRAFDAAGAFGCAAIALVTVQSTAGLRDALALAPARVLAQVREVVLHQRVLAVKIGALGSAANTRAVAGWVAKLRGVPVVVDTPMLPTRRVARGARLLDARALTALRTELLPHATLVTANVAEAEALVGTRITGLSDAHDAAVALCRLGARAAMVKGGHLAPSSAQAIDVLAIGGDVVELRAKRLALPPTHGTGCTFASLVAGRLAARGWSEKTGDASLIEAVRWAKRVHHGALASVKDVGEGMRVIAF